MKDDAMISFDFNSATAEFLAPKSTIHLAINAGCIKGNAVVIRETQNLGLPFRLDHSWSFNEFLSKASNFLCLVPEATHAYSSTGTPLHTDCLMIDNNSTVYLSYGEAFVVPIQSNSKHGQSYRLSIGKDNRLPDKVQSYLVGSLLEIDTLGRQICLGTGEISGTHVNLKFFMYNRYNHRDDDYEMQAENEITCLRGLAHPHILPLIERVKTSRHLVMITEHPGTGGMIR